MDISTSNSRLPFHQHGCIYTSKFLLTGACRYLYIYVYIYIQAFLNFYTSDFFFKFCRNIYFNLPVVQLDQHFKEESDLRERVDIRILALSPILWNAPCIHQQFFRAQQFPFSSFSRTVLSLGKCPSLVVMYTTRHLLIPEVKVLPNEPDNKIKMSSYPRTAHGSGLDKTSCQ